MYQPRITRTRNFARMKEEEKVEEVQNVNGSNLNPTSNSLVISNKDDRYSLKYGPEFGGLLDARDQVMEHKFNFSFTFEELNQLKGG